VRRAWVWKFSLTLKGITFSIGFWEGMKICTWYFIYPPPPLDRSLTFRIQTTVVSECTVFYLWRLHLLPLHNKISLVITRIRVHGSWQPRQPSCTLFKLKLLLRSFWSQWCFLQSDWLWGVRFVLKSHASVNQSY
jgi:hypothetical protein